MNLHYARGGKRRDGDAEVGVCQNVLFAPGQRLPDFRAVQKDAVSRAESAWQPVLHLCETEV